MTIFRTFTDTERAALTLHGLDTHRPSQLSDAFVLGMRHAGPTRRVQIAAACGEVFGWAKPDAGVTAGEVRDCLCPKGMLCRHRAAGVASEKGQPQGLTYNPPPHMQAAALIERAAKQLRAWHQRYGEFQPNWLPPAGDVRWLEDADAYLAAHALPAPTAGVPASGNTQQEQPR